MIAHNTQESNPQISELLLITYMTFRIYAVALNGRLARAYRIASDGEVSQVDANTWQVAAGTNGRQPYTVSFDLTWKCTCPDCDPGDGHAPVIEFCGSTQATCKHIAAVAMCWTAKLDIPQAQATNGRTYNRSTTCEACRRDWQECNCPPSKPLPQPAKITTLSPEAKRKFQEMIEHSQQRNATGAKALSAALKSDGNRRTACEFTNVQRY